MQADKLRELVAKWRAFANVLRGSRGGRNYRIHGAGIVAAAHVDDCADELEAELLALAEGAEADRADANHRRYQWAANELLACDYGDNERGEIGWIVYGWRGRRGETVRRIYGPTIDAAIDAALSGAVTQREG